MKTLKTVLCLMLALCMVFAMISCAEKKTDEKSKEKTEAAETEEKKTEEKKTEEKKTEAAATEDKKTEDAGTEGKKTESSAPALTGDDFVGDWKFVVNKDNFDDVEELFDLFGSLDLDTLEAFISKEEMADSMIDLFSAYRFSISENTVKFTADTDTYRSAMKSLYTKMLDGFSGMSIEDMAEMFGGADPAVIRESLESAGVSWEDYLGQYIASQRETLMNQIDEQSDEEILGSLGNDREIAYSVKDGKLVLGDDSSSMTFSYSDGVLKLEETKGGEGSEGFEQFAELLENVTLEKVA
ncbi:MAG: hypothetical protein IJV00_10995 [Clostridia bacterium]|nr:hypothetical protein [Clostridia bacterium]